MCTMDSNLEFLRGKILQAQHSCCCIETGSALLETYVVETEKIDDGGNICFFIPQPQAGAVNHSVVNIRYQNEQQAYCVKVLGRIIEQPTHLAIVYSYGECRMQYLKVKAKILSAEY